jgi:hypothetical protein
MNGRILRTLSITCSLTSGARAKRSSIQLLASRGVSSVLLFFCCLGSILTSLSGKHHRRSFQA